MTFRSFFIAAVFTIAGCISPHTGERLSRKPNSDFDNTLAKSCFDSLKSRQDALLFQNVHDKEVETALEAVDSDPEYHRSPDYALTTKNDAVTEIGIESGVRTENISKEFNVRFTPPDDQSAGALMLKLSSELLKYNHGVLERTTIEQEILLTSICFMKVLSTDFTTSKIANGEVKIRERKLFPNGETDYVVPTSETLKVPADAKMITTSFYRAKASDLTKLAQQLNGTRGYMYLSPQLGAYEVSLQAKLQKTVPSFEAVIFYDQKKIYDETLSFTDKGRTYGTIDDGVTKTVSYEEWNKAWFPPITIPELYAHIDDGASLYANPIHLIFSTKFSLPYSNIAPYWKVLAQRKNPNKDESVFENQEKLESVPVPDYANADLPVKDPQGTGQRYLSDSYYLELENPEVKAKVTDLKRQLKPGMNRAQIAAEIVQYLPSILKADESITQDPNYVPNWKTSEIISRKIGVCQQYAFMFMALARSLGVPAREVAGLMLTGNNLVGFHAWNEFEVRNGVWVPIEPQMTTLQFFEGRYIPLTVEHFEKNPFRGPYTRKYYYNFYYDVNVITPETSF